MPKFNQPNQQREHALANQGGEMMSLCMINHHVLLTVWESAYWNNSFKDNRLLCKWTFSPMGHFSNHWGFRLMDQ